MLSNGLVGLEDWSRLGFVVVMLKVCDTVRWKETDPRYTCVHSPSLCNFLCPHRAGLWCQELNKAVDDVICLQSTPTATA